MSDPARCSSCGLPLDRPGPDGLCPACLLKLGQVGGLGQVKKLGDTATTTAPGGAGVAGSDATYLPADAAAARASGRTADSAGVPSVIGPYHLLQALGEGGMGLVYLAEQRDYRTH
jgi:serine/threonine protein kinase